MANSLIRRLSVAALATFVVSLISPSATQLFSQTTGDSASRWASWWYGVYGGVNYSSFTGELNNFGTLVEPASTFDAGTGLGFAAGGVLEFNPGKLLGFNLLLGYDTRPISFDQVQSETESGATFTEDLSTSFSYLAVEPSLRINLGSRFFHAVLGPGFGFNLGKGSEYTLVDSTGQSTTQDLNLQNVRSFALDAKVGLGYDIPLAGEDASTQILLTPFAEFRLPITDYVDSEGDEFKRIGIRGGLQLKFGSRPAGAVVKGPDGQPISYEPRVDAPIVIAESRRINETFPLRNYIFFDEGSTDIPSRYTRLSTQQASNFREEQLLRLEETTGSSTSSAKNRSQRQMQVYYSMLNVYGDRMRRNPAVRVTLTGSANGDAAKGKQMAENVKNYLVSTFGIAADRIETKGQAMPTNKSGSGSSSGEDKEMINAENWRVEINGTPEDILAPVKIVTLEEEPVGNDVIFRVNGDDNVAKVTIQIAERDGATRTFGPYDGNKDVRIDARDLLGDGNRDARYTATIEYLLKDGTTYQSQGKQFRLVRADPDEEQTAVRYSILFEFDQSKTVKTYERFLTETVAPEIPNGATVIIHGHTDAIGTPEYNIKLSDQRVDETRRILTEALTAMGRKVTFDSYGFGEDNKRSPFSNSQPEQRFYNRTVVIEIIPGG